MKQIYWNKCILILLWSFLISCKGDEVDILLESEEELNCENAWKSEQKIEAPEYDSFELPAVGETFNDPVFCTEVKRLTADQSIQGFNGERAMFSPDDKYFVVQVKGGVRLFDGLSGDIIEDLPIGGDKGQRLRWSRVDHLLYHEGKELLEFNVQTKAVTVLHTFERDLGSGPNNRNLGGGDANDLDDNKEWIVLNHGDIFFAFNIKTKEKGPEKNMNRSGFDYLTISPSGKYIVANMRDANPQSFVRWNRDWSDEYQFFPNSCHSDLYAIDGEDYFLGKRGLSGDYYNWLKANDVENTNSIVSVKLSDGSANEILTQTQYGEQMFSAVGGSGNRMAVVAIESNGYNPKDTGWGRYNGEIVLLGLDGSTPTRRLVHHRARPTNGTKHNFEDQPEAWINHAGTRVFFRSNMANYSEEGKHDLYMIMLDK